MLRTAIRCNFNPVRSGSLRLCGSKRNGDVEAMQAIRGSGSRSGYAWSAPGSASSGMTQPTHDHYNAAGYYGSLHGHSSQWEDYNRGAGRW